MIGFTKTKLPYGWMGNMSAYPIQVNGVTWKTSEALFQAMRFDDAQVIDEIRECKSPFGAKCIAKRHKEKMVVVPTSDEDVENMRVCLNLKFEQHDDIMLELKQTAPYVVYENVKSRGKRGNNLFWGAILEDDVLVGKNILGKLLMEIRDTITF